MEKIIRKKLFFTHCGRLLSIRVKVCLLCILCFLTILVEANSSPVEFLSIDSEITTNPELQQNVVKGTIKDAATGEAMIGVTVMMKGTTMGTLTDINGQFSLNIPEKQAVLTISFIGYTTQEIPVTSGVNLNVSLSIEVTQISEVVVVGYGTQKKESMVGAISQVNSEALVRSGAPNVSNALTGKLSGVLTIQQTGEPGKNQAEIIVRGLSSWSGSAPLTLIDGVERDFQDMDPNEISTISVLKDASATAVFGAKGANGVIIVTTKRGTLGKPQLTFTGSTGVAVPSNMPTYIDSYTTLSMLNVARMNQQLFTVLTPEYALEQYRNPSSPLKSLQYPNVDWFDVNSKGFAPTANANISVIGGTNFVKYFATIGYMYEGSFFKQDKKSYINDAVDSRFWYNRFNYRTNLDFTLTKTTLLSLNVGGEVGIKNNPLTGKYGDWRAFYQTTGTDFPPYWPAWVLEEIPDLDYPNASGIRRASSGQDWYTNPYNDINKGEFERYLNTKLFTDLIIDQKLDFILKGLSARGKMAFNTNYSHNILYSSYTIPMYSVLWDRVGVDADGDGKVDKNPWRRYGEGQEYYYPAPLDVNVGGFGVSTGGLGDLYSEPDAFYSDLYYEMSLNYGNTFGHHSFTGLALMNRQEKNLGTQFPYYNAAFVGRVTYDYSGKYLAEINLGYTGSERFAPSNRYGFFPSGAIGWVISQEDFFKNAVPWMNKLKLRYSQGTVGSDAASSRWLYVSDFLVDPRGYIHEDKGANVSTQWEEARKRDLGIEIGVFENMFTLNVDLFDENRSKMLLTPRSVTFFVGNSFKDLNLGRLRKHGIEIEAAFNKTTAYNLKYYIKSNFGFNENRIIFKDDPIYSLEYTKAAGKPIDARLNGQVKTGYFSSVNDIHINPSPVSLESTYFGDYKFLDYKSDGAINSSDTYPVEGHSYAPITYSVTGGLGYKGFEFNMMFQGDYGKNTSLGALSEIEFYKGGIRVHSTHLNYWRPDNQDEATHSTMHYNVADLGDGNTSWTTMNLVDHWWREASYLRLKEIYAGYNFVSEYFNRTVGISNILVYLNAINVLTFTKLPKEFDPEVKSFGSGWYPMLSRYNVGVKFSF